MSFFSTGEQPAAALPAGTLAYVGIDLDPSGGQKIEALRMLNKFPAFKDELGLDTDDDLRKALFDEIQGGEDACANLEYARDVESWLGNRAGVGTVDAEPTVVFVVQVSDADAAAAGLEKLRTASPTATRARPRRRTPTSGSPSRATGPCSPRRPRSPSAWPPTVRRPPWPTTPTSRRGPTAAGDPGHPDASTPRPRRPSDGLRLGRRLLPLARGLDPSMEVEGVAKPTATR